MGISVKTNIASISAQTNIRQTTKSLNQSIQNLASGQRINVAADDPAGLAISSKLRANIDSLQVASRNANDGISLLQTAEGSMNEVSGILTRMRELAMQSSTDTVGDSERAFVQQEFSALMEEIDRIANVTEFNGTQLLDGSATGLDFQVGIRDTANDRITVAIADMRSTALGTGGGGAAIGTAGVDSRANAQASLDIIDAAIQDVSAGRAGIGAAENRLQVTIANINVSRENLSAANSRIRDTDVAEESAAMTRASILMQAGVSVLAQANQTPQMALNLLG
jgi:flagellin